ncbi:MAG: LacI family DNA-binding transcriptional regulator [Microbacteriaceae bacterium]
MNAVPEKKVGIRDVAREAGVSTATVSQVYNNKGEVAATTRQKVLEVGRALGYRPNAIGQALRSGKSRVIGVVVSYRDSVVWEQTYMPYYRNIIAGAAIEAVDHGYSISAAPSTEEGRIETYVPLDGVIVVDPVPLDPIVEQALERGLAVVTDGGYSTNLSAKLVTVRSDMSAAIPLMLSHLESKHGAPEFRPALFIGPRIDDYTATTARAYRTWCEERSIDPLVVSPEGEESPLDAARLLLAQGDVHAVHCLNETYSTAVMLAAAEAELDVSGDLQVSVSGNASAAGADQRVAYLDIDPVTTGAICARTLIALVEGESVDDIVRPVHLVPARVG